MITGDKLDNWDYLSQIRSHQNLELNVSVKESEKEVCRNGRKREIPMDQRKLKGNKEKYNKRNRKKQK